MMQHSPCDRPACSLPLSVPSLQGSNPKNQPWLTPPPPLPFMTLQDVQHIRDRLPPCRAGQHQCAPAVPSQPSQLLPPGCAPHGAQRAHSPHRTGQPEPQVGMMAGHAVRSSRGSSSLWGQACCSGGRVGGDCGTRHVRHSTMCTGRAPHQQGKPPATDPDHAAPTSSFRRQNTLDRARGLQRPASAHPAGGSSGSGRLLGSSGGVPGAGTIAPREMFTAGAMAAGVGATAPRQLERQAAMGRQRPQSARPVLQSTPAAAAPAVQPQAPQTAAPAVPPPRQAFPPPAPAAVDAYKGPASETITKRVHWGAV